MERALLGVLLRHLLSLGLLSERTYQSAADLADTEEPFPVLFAAAPPPAGGGNGR